MLAEYFEAQKETSDKNNKTSKTDVVISVIAKLYAIEKKLQSPDEAERYRIRQ